jgi:hypothetical protein
VLNGCAGVLLPFRCPCRPMTGWSGTTKGSQAAPQPHRCPLQSLPPQPPLPTRLCAAAWTALVRGLPSEMGRTSVGGGPMLRGTPSEAERSGASAAIRRTTPALRQLLVGRTLNEGTATRGSTAAGGMVDRRRWSAGETMHLTSQTGQHATAEGAAVRGTTGAPAEQSMTV